MKKNSLNHMLLLIGFLSLLMSSCKHDRNHPGYAYMPDMYYSEPYDLYTANPIFADSITMQGPVEGTIPRGHMPYSYQAKSADDQKRAGEELENPIALDEATLASGKEHYEIFCALCHGPAGKGDGTLFKSGKFIAQPTSLVEDYVQGKKDGEIYHVITTGSVSGLMGAHGAQITPKNRWEIIHYVRKLAE
ncbi:MAG TPA: cytochrome c [Bacteroidales bacterium]|nr:cytochrome c [Bacteroidales bacterium]HNS46258.1 cytochrome c [Bacteroidales bacterium]